MILVEDRKFVSASSSTKKQGFVCKEEVVCLLACPTLPRKAAIRKHLEPLYMQTRPLSKGLRFCCFY